MAFPCGKCYDCKTRRISAWSFRLMNEYLTSRSGIFLTLTYNTLTIPINEAGQLTLLKRDVQLFFKKLRKLNANKIKYYAVGEYGTIKARPHYHIILFNADVNTIQTAWDKGEFFVGTLTDASVGYTLGYISKKPRIPEYTGDYRQKEFSLMSKRMGLDYLKPNMIKWHHADFMNRYYIPLLDGKKIAFPRYYKEKIYSQEQREQIGINLQNVLEKKYQELSHEQKLEQLKKQTQRSQWIKRKNTENRKTTL